jgi:parafibromin
MYNVKRFLEDAAFEPSSDAKARAVSEGNGRVEDMIPIYRKKTQIGPGGKEIVTSTRYFVVDGVDALSKFGADAWYVLYALNGTCRVLSPD